MTTPTRHIGVQVGAVDSFGRRILEGVISYAQQQQHWRISWDRYYQPTFWQRRSHHGLIVEARETSRIARLRELKIPIVVVSGIAAANQLHLVTVDEIKLVGMACQHFREIGIKRIAYVSLERPSYLLDSRGGAFKSEAPNYFDPNNVFSFYLKKPVQSETVLVDVLREWIRTLPTPIGILARRDHTSYLIAEACALAGIRVPEEIAILGVDNDPLFCELCHPTLSSIDHGAVQIGRQAAYLLDRLMANESVPLDPVHIEPVRVVRRRSTDAMMMDDPLVAQALQIIRLRACDGLTVPQLLAEVAVSRNTLESRLMQRIGYTAHQEILRVRLEHAKMLLTETDWPMPDITAHCGFSYASHFCSVFRKEFGLTPTAYRQKMQQTLANS